MISKMTSEAMTIKHFRPAVNDHLAGGIASLRGIREYRAALQIMEANNARATCLGARQIALVAT